MFFCRLVYFLLSDAVDWYLPEGAEIVMSFFFSPNFVAISRPSCKRLLLILWFVGCVSGILIAACTDISASWMLTCFDAGVSIVGLFFVPFLPFVISAVAVFYSTPLFIYLSALAKAFLIGFTCCVVSASCVSGGWLLCFLLLFTDLLTGPALIWFQLRCLVGGRKNASRCAIPVLLWFVAVSVVDYLWIVPLLRDII